MMLPIFPVRINSFCKYFRLLFLNKCLSVRHKELLRNFSHTYTAQAGYGSGKIFIDNIRVNPYCFKNLRRPVASAEC